MNNPSRDRLELRNPVAVPETMDLMTDQQLPCEVLRVLQERNLLNAEAVTYLKFWLEHLPIQTFRFHSVVCTEAPLGPEPRYDDGKNLSWPNTKEWARKGNIWTWCSGTVEYIWFEFCFAEFPHNKE